MPRHVSSAGLRRKRSLSPHQKQIRFFTWASLVTAYVLATALFLLMNKLGVLRAATTKIRRLKRIFGCGLKVGISRLRGHHRKTEPEFETVLSQCRQSLLF